MDKYFVPTIVGIIIIVVVLYLYFRNKSQSKYITIALIVVGFIFITYDNWEYIEYDFSEHKLTLKAKDRDEILTNLVKNKPIINEAATDTTTAISKSAPTIPDKILDDLTEFIDLLIQTKTEKQFSFEDWYYKGAGEFINKRYARAVISFTKALEKEPDDTSAAYTHNYRGAAYGRLGKNEEALEEYNESVRLYPKNDLAYNNRAVIYYHFGQYVKAIKESNKASILYIIKGDYIIALSITTRALSLSPKIEDNAILLYLECVAKKKLNNEDASECKTEFNGNLKKVSTLSWSSDEIESWLKEAKIQKETHTFIGEMIDSLKKYKK